MCSGCWSRLQLACSSPSARRRRPASPSRHHSCCRLASPRCPTEGDTAARTQHCLRCHTSPAPPCHLCGGDAAARTQHCRCRCHARLRRPSHFHRARISPHPRFERLCHRVTGDISAGIRVERGGESYDVWLVTPQSARWDPVRVAVPLQTQLARVRPHGLGQGPCTLRMLQPTRAAPRLLRTPMNVRACVG